MSYVKNCNPGKITVDLPWSNYFHELPLFSFGDIHGELNLSLVFNYQMKEETQNPFFIKEGYKLNIHKMLIFEDGIPVALMEGSGKCITIWGEAWPYGFDDNSQRFIRQTGDTTKPYVVENADYSKEYYNADGMIVSTVDKYGVEVLKYTYNTRYGWLTSVKYRNEKTIQFTYSNSKLYKITYSGSGCTSTLSYPTVGVDIQHYAGEVFHLESDGMNFTATAATAGYATKLTKTSDFLLTVSDYIAGQVVNSTTYYFYLGANGSASNYVDITNNEGVKTRCQYWRGKLTSSYEVAGSDVSFVSDKFTGCVQIQKTMESPYNSGAMGAQYRNDGIPMTFFGSTSPQEWSYDVNAYAEDGAAGYYVLTGWTKRLGDGNASISIAGLTNGYQYSYEPDTDRDDKWKFFAYRFYANAAFIRVYLPSAELLETKDFRITFQQTHVLSDDDESKIAVMEYGLIPSSNTSAFVPIHECEFIYTYTTEDGGAEEENISANYTITFQDLLKHKTNKKKNVHSGEVYINGCEEAFVLGSSGSFVARHTNPETEVVTNYSVNSCHLAIKQYVANKMVTTRIRDDIAGSCLTYQTLNEAGAVIAYKALDSNLDVIEEYSENVTTTYTRSNDLITAVRVDEPNSYYTRTTANGTDSSGNPTVTMTDEFNKSTVYTLDPLWGVVKSATLPDGTVVTNEYDDDMCAMTKRTFGSTTGRSNSLTFSNGNLSAVETGNLSYDFAYTKGKLSAVSKNNSSVEEHVHTGNTRTESYYPSQANTQHSTKANFDKYGRLLNIDGVMTNTYDIMPTFNSSGTMTAIANNGDALLATTTDEMRGEKARFTYDYCSRMLTKKEVTSSTNFATKVSKETFAYDDAKRMTQDVCIYDQPNAKQVTSTISYVKTATDPLADERVGTYTYAIKNSATAITQNTFDDLKRVKTKAHTIGGMQFKKTMSFDRTRVSRVRDTIVSTTKTDHYYDECNRIQKIDANGVISTYHYDQYGQLVREDNQGLDMTMVYEYNNIGNLISAKKYSYTASTSSPSGTPVTTSFGYTDDKLTSFGGATIAYNAMGRPTTYEGKNLTWSNGKLSRMSSGTLAAGTDTYAFVYNAFGQRIGKTYSYLAGTSSAVQIGQLTGANKTYYYDHAGRLISETVSKTYNSAASSSESIVFLYDESSIIGMVRTVNGTANTYYFQRNLLGDVVAIYDTSGNMVAKYLYDAWGNCTISGESTNTAVAAANPIRYRGYYYDDDTGLYYCNARYYSPKWRRFISPDDTAYLDPESVNGLNLYCYCNNDPVNYCDPSGHSLAVIALIALGVFTVAGGVLGGFYEGSIYNNITGQNQETESGPLSFGDRLKNIALGATLGLAVGSALVMLTAGVVAGFAGGATVAVAIGGTAAQMFAIGALAYNAYLLISMFWNCAEVEFIELPTTELPR